MSNPITLTAAQALEKFRGYVDLACPALTAVIYAKQATADAPRPTMPYATVEAVRGEDLASPYIRVGDELAEPEGTADERTHEFEQTWARQLVVEVHGYGDAAPALIDALVIARNRIPESEYLAASGITARPLSDVMDTRTLRDTEHEVSAFQEWGVVYCAKDVSSTATIETVNTLGYTGFPAAEE